MRERTKSNARRLARSDRWDRPEGCSRERTRPWQRGLPNKLKENQQSTRWWLLPCLSVRWSAWIHALTTNKKGSSSLTKLDNKPDWFCATQNAYCFTQQYCGQSAVSPQNVDNTPVMDVNRVHRCCCCCGSSWALLYLCKLFFQQTLDLQCLIAFNIDK
jgi:hypothetical protein